MTFREHRDQILASSIEVVLPTPNDFLKVRETLTRIGIGSVRPDGSKTLYQSAHILHKQGRYYIIHYKQMYLLDGRIEQTDFSADDQCRVVTIALMLETWGLVKILYPDRLTAPRPVSAMTILRFKQKADWRLVPKYTIGKFKKAAVV